MGLKNKIQKQMQELFGEENSAVVEEKVSLIKAIDEDEQIVYGEVYAPNVMDAHGDIMMEDGVKQMAHDFMKLILSETIDKNHDNNSTDAYPVESFINSYGIKAFNPGAWVLGVKIVDPNDWHEVKTGKLNGFSFQAMCKKQAAVADIDIYSHFIEYTEETQGHKHLYFAKIDDDGHIEYGRTSTVNGHAHDIISSSVTETTNGHNHRFFM